jgi:uncharacterized protein (TIGR03000 family)
MLRRKFWVSLVFASVAVIAFLEVAIVQAGPAVGGRSSGYRVGGSYSYSAPAAVVAGDFSPLYSSQPLLYAYYVPAVRSSAGGEEESDVRQDAAAKIELTVPVNAEVWVDGNLTGQTGNVRSFVTPPLQPGKTFSYDLRVRWTAAGGIVVDVTRPIQVRAGRQTMVGFKQ